MKTNLVIVGLLDEKVREIASRIASDFDMYFADLREILKYSLTNSESEIKKKCGLDYLQKLKREVVENISTYENTLIYTPFSLFLSENNAKVLSKYSTIVFLDFDKKICENIIKKETDELKAKDYKVLLLAYDERTSLCSKESNIKVKLNKDKLELNYKHTKNFIEKYYL